MATAPRVDQAERRAHARSNTSITRVEDATYRKLRESAPSVLTRPTFTLADRLRIQQEAARNRDFIVIGKLTVVCFEAQRSLSAVGFSQSQPRWMNPEQAKPGAVPESMRPFSEAQAMLWPSLTLDWLSHKKAPTIAISRDRRDLLLPYGMTPLPDIPDPRWAPRSATEVCPRIPQLLTGCPVVGDRVRDKLTDRSGRCYGVLHPITQMCLTLLGPKPAFVRIKGGVDPADGTHLAMLIDDSDPEQMQAYFVGGRFQFGG